MTVFNNDGIIMSHSASEFTVETGEQRLFRKTQELEERIDMLEAAAAKQVTINANILLVLQQLREQDTPPRSRLILPN